MTDVGGVPLRTDCLQFRGDIPCKPHKEFGVHCSACDHYQPRAGRLLIIKLGAAGDVIRTTVILDPLQAKYPGYEIWWLTLTPDLVPQRVHKRLRFSAESLLTLQQISFDVVVNLDKDLHACALMASLTATERFGFTLSDGVPAPVNALAEHKFVTGVFDDLNQQNTLSYPQEIIEICGLDYARQEYIMDPPGPNPLTLPQGSGPVIGLNTGCGDRWIAREWPIDSWIALINGLMERGYRVVLLGGPSEHERNVMLKERTGATYEGTWPLKQFLGVVNGCDVVVTAVTMAMHIALGLRKQLVLMNNIFNRHEFELYDRGVLIEPDKECTCFFRHDCVRTDYRCMDHLPAQKILDAVDARVAYL